MNPNIFSVTKTILSVALFTIRTLWSTLKSLKSFLLILFLVLSITLNGVLFMGGKVYSAASSIFDAVTGLRSVATQHASDIADISDDLMYERRVKRELKAEVRGLTEKLALERSAKRQLQAELSETAARRASLRVKREAVDTITDRISRRTARSASRDVGSMVGEAIPYAGIAIIVGATTLELKDLCDTMKDMQELKEIFNPDAAPDENVTTVCAMKVPTKEEIWIMVKAAPGDAWEGVKAWMPELPEFPEIDWSTVWDSIEDGPANLWGTVKYVGDRTVNGAVITWDRASTWGMELPDRVSGWWNGASE